MPFSRPPEPPLSERLRALVVTQCGGPATLFCRFVAGGKLHGVGIASDLWCQTCGQARTWHDVAQAAAIAAAQEAIV